MREIDAKERGTENDHENGNDDMSFPKRRSHKHGQYQIPNRKPRDVSYDDEDESDEDSDGGREDRESHVISQR